MIVSSVLSNPALPRLGVLGLFGGIGLALTAIYSRRGPLIYPVYAAALAAMAAVLARYPTLPFVARWFAALVGFAAASAVLYVTVGWLAARQRVHLVAIGRLPENRLHTNLSVRDHAWRIAFLLAVGALASAGVAFVSA